MTVQSGSRLTTGITKAKLTSIKLDYKDTLPIFLDTAGKRVRYFLLGLSLIFLILAPTFYYLYNDLITTAEIRSLLAHSTYTKDSIQVDVKKQSKNVWGILNSETDFSFGQLRQSQSKLNNLILEITNDKKPNLELQTSDKAVGILEYLTNQKENLKSYLKLPIQTIKETEKIKEIIKKYNFNGIVVKIEHEKEINLDNISALKTTLATNNSRLAFMISEEISTSGLVSLQQFSSDLIVNYHDIQTLKRNQSASINTIPLIENATQLYNIGENDREFIGKMSYAEALETLSKYQADISTLKNGIFEYTENGNRYELEIRDGISFFNQLQQLESITSINSLVIADLGYEEPAVLELPNLENSSARLNFLRDNYTSTSLVRTENEGQIVELVTLPKSGKRELTVDKAGTITAQKILSNPVQAVINRSGKSANSITLTFDDGCDPIYTPKILDILKANNVHATFYAIGEQVQKYPEIARRIVDEGNILANHTFTHPHSSLVNPETLINEIAATNVVIKAKTGSQPKYFRVPYNDTNEYETNIDTQILQIAKGNNLLLTGFDIDPRDWEVNNKDEIINNVLDKAKTSGGQILLHDSGADRTSTVEALPTIIKKLRAAGKTFVNTDQLAATTTQADASILSDKYFQQAKTIQNSEQDSNSLDKKLSFFGINSLIILGFMLQICLFFSLLQFSIIVFALVSNLLKKSKILKTKKQSTLLNQASIPSVSVLVPCYNENIVICKTINSLLTSSYYLENTDKFEIIIIDDGSKDNTWQILQDNYTNHQNVRIFTKPNGGKARALNYGLKKAKNEIVICIDADTIFNSEAISELVKHFTNPKVAGVAGNVIVGNGKPNLLTQCQNLEYTFSQNFTKLAQEWLGCITVVPGAIGAWRKQVLVDIGGYEPDTLAEDADLTIRVLERGWKISYEPLAFSITEAPESWVSFWKQRYRWQFGSLQVLFKNKHLLFNPKYGSLGLFALPFTLLYYLFVVISPLTNLVLVIYLLKFGWYLADSTVMTFSQSDINGIKQIAFVFLAYLFFDFITNLVALKLDKYPHKKFSSLIYLLAQTFIIKPVLYVISVKVITKALLGRVGGWGHLKRTGSVKSV